MEPKKSKKVDLEQKRSLFLLIGLVVSMGFVLTAFMGNREVKSIPVFDPMSISDPGVDVFTPLPPETPKLPPPPKPLIVEFLKIIHDNSPFEEPEFVSSEINEGMIIDVIPILKPEKPDHSEEEVFYFVDEMPEFPGGEESLLRWISMNVKYPAIAIENQVDGTVIVSFVVDRDGSITQIVLARSIDPSLDREALRVVGNMPRWKPGISAGKPVRVSYTIPIRFELKQ